jgi:hypothetical protein
VPLEDDSVSAELVDTAGNPVTVAYDSDRGVYLLSISGQVVVAPPAIPSGATPVTVENNDPLNLTGGASPDDETYTITNGTTFYVTQFIAGGESNPTAAGSVVEIYFDDGTEHLVSRIYINGNTASLSFNCLCEARDGTTLTGNGTNTMIVRRRRLSNAASEVEGVLYGYEV